jgi:hypothetical protein
MLKIPKKISHDQWTAIVSLYQQIEKTALFWVTRVTADICGWSSQLIK